MKLEKIKKFESCRLSNSVINNILGGVVDGCATTDAGTATNTNCNCAMRYSSDQWTWDTSDPNGTLAYTHNWGTKDDASIYHECR
jgi:hypothetical protein